MIVGIEGKIEKKEPTFIHLNVSGLIYEVHMSINCSSKIDKSNVKLFITQIIREDSQSLYGFIDYNEKKVEVIWQLRYEYDGWFFDVYFVKINYYIIVIVPPIAAWLPQL